MRRDYRLLCVSRALSPITHNSGSEGNETLVMAEPVAVDGRVAHIPMLTGNALRHRMVREPGARDLVLRLGAVGHLSIAQLQYLFHGGALTQGSPTESTQRVADCWRLFPLLRVLGGCLPDLLVGGSLHAHRGVLACAENAERIRALLPEGFRLGALMQAERLIGRYQYVRDGSGRSYAEQLPAGSVECASGQMIYSGQMVMPGAVFLHGFSLRNALERDLGALLVAIGHYCAAGGVVGGSAAKGHGRLDTRTLLTPAVDAEAAMRAYADHVEAHREEALAWLQAQFAARAPRAAAAAKGGRGRGRRAADPAAPVAEEAIDG